MSRVEGASSRVSQIRRWSSFWSTSMTWWSRLWPHSRPILSWPQPFQPLTAMATLWHPHHLYPLHLHLTELLTAMEWLKQLPSQELHHLHHLHQDQPAMLLIAMEWPKLPPSQDPPHPPHLHQATLQQCHHHPQECPVMSQSFSPPTSRSTQPSGDTGTPCNTISKRKMQVTWSILLFQWAYAIYN